MDLSDVAATVLHDMQVHLGRGRVADYIPALARVDPRHFGLAIVTCDGEVAAAGDAGVPFSVQSISKVFTLTMALEQLGSDLWERVGREPSGSPFNSIVQLERERGVPRNPLINAGALVVADALLDGGDPAAAIEAIIAFVRRAADDPGVGIDPEVAASEAETGFRNASLANFLRAEGNLHSPVGDVLRVYFNQCALSLNCRQLARSALYLAAGGADPLTGAKITTPMRARRINSLMMTSGHYDASGDFAFRVGLPGKSGVGGGILAIAPRRAAIAAWSPGLNPQGSSLVGVLALQRLASLTGWSVF
ncbi:MAG: glutaminase [Caulobacteraceae bacterium]